MLEDINPIIVHGLICSRDVNMALEGFSSLLKFSDIPINLLLHDDGSLTSKDREVLLSGLPGSQIILRSHADAEMEESLKNYPNCRLYRKEYVYGLKLLDISLMSDGDFGYCDSDILFMRPFKNLFKWPDSKTSAIFMQDYLDAYSMLPWYLIGKQNTKLVSKVNAGLIFFRKKDYDLDFIEWFLGEQRFRHKVGWLEQTCWAALGHRVGCRQWNPNQVVLMRPWTEDSSQLIAGHFVKESRYRMKEFLPISEQNLKSSPAVEIETFIPQDCSLMSLGLVHVKRQLKRAKNYRKFLGLTSAGNG
jgi:hypothetical protein